MWTIIKLSQIYLLNILVPIHSKMEEFDFNAPVYATVIFEDSDDDTKPCSEDRACIPLELSLPEEVPIKEKENVLKENPSTRTENIDSVVQQDRTIVANNKDQCGAISQLHQQKISIETVIANVVVKEISSNKNNNCYSISIETTNQKNASNINKINNIHKIKQCNQKPDKNSDKNILDMPTLDIQDNLLQEFNVILNEVANEKNKYLSLEKANIIASSESNKVENRRNVITPKEKSALISNTTTYTPRFTSETSTKNSSSHTDVNRNKNIKNCTKVDVPKTNKKMQRKRKESTDTNNNSTITKPNEKSRKSTNAHTDTCFQGFRADNIESNISFTNTAIETSGVPQTDVDVTFYMRKLIDSVSEHMIYILNAYHIYIHIYKTTRNADVIRNAKQSFRISKQHFFNLSYNSVVDIIIPRENDVRFVKRFLDETIALANSRNYRYSYPHVHPLFIELVYWVKKKKQEIDAMQTQQTTHPMLTQMLCKPQTLTQINTNRDPPPYRSPNNALQNIPLNSNYIDSQNIRRDNYIAGNESQRAAEYNLNQCRTSQAQQNTEPRLSLQNFVDNAMSIPLSANNDRTSYQNNSLFGGGHILLEQTYTNQFPSQQHPSEQLSQRQQQSEQFNQGYNRHDQMVQNNLAATHQYQEQCLQQQYYSEVVAEEQHPNVNNSLVLETSRSSISRDSGFISPLNLNGTNEQSVLEDKSSEVTPLITHVTSLNSKASYIRKGLCSICSTITRKKCLGCYSCYYCSSQCQLRDWTKHQSICKLYQYITP